MSNRSRTVFYVGFTGKGERRIYEHVSKRYIHSFTSRYNIRELLHVEEFDNTHDAITREKQLKKWSRAKKIALIKMNNPEMKNMLVDV